MYNMNYIDGVITKEKYGSAVVKFLKILNFFVQLAIIVILIFSFLAHSKMCYYNTKIDETKREIEEKRATNRISDVEKEWEVIYYKLLAVKTQLDKCSMYGFVFRDLGLFLPVENSVLDLSFEKNNSLFHLTINKDVLQSLTSFYDYTPFLSEALEKSSYLGKDVQIQDLEEQKINNVDMKILKTVIPLKLRKQ